MLSHQLSRGSRRFSIKKGPCCAMPRSRIAWCGCGKITTMSWSLLSILRWRQIKISRVISSMPGKDGSSADFFSLMSRRSHHSFACGFNSFQRSSRTWLWSKCIHAYSLPTVSGSAKSPLVSRSVDLELMMSAWMSSLITECSVRHRSLLINRITAVDRLVLFGNPHIKSHKSE